MLVHYDDLSADLEGEMRHLAELLGITVAETKWPEFIDAAGFEQMKARADQLAPDPADVLKDRTRFFRRGSSGAGLELLSSAREGRLPRPHRAVGPTGSPGVAPPRGSTRRLISGDAFAQI